MIETKSTEEPNDRDSQKLNQQDFQESELDSSIEDSRQKKSDNDSLSSISLVPDYGYLDKKIKQSLKIPEFSPTISSAFYSYALAAGKVFCCDFKSPSSLNTSISSLTSPYMSYQHSSLTLSSDSSESGFNFSDYIAYNYGSTVTQTQDLSHIIEQESRLFVCVKNFRDQERTYPLPSFDEYSLIDSTFEEHLDVMKISKKKKINGELSRLTLVKAQGFDEEGVFSLIPDSTLIAPRKLNEYYKTHKEIRFAVYHALGSSTNDNLTDLELFAVKCEKIETSYLEALKHLKILEKKLDKEYHFTSLVGTRAFKALRVTPKIGNIIKINTYLFTPFIRPTKISHSMQVLCGIYSKLAFEVNKTQNLGVLHGDIDPSNIVIDKNENPHLIGWELAVSVNNKDARQSGKIGFMAPDLRKSWSSESYSLLKTLLIYTKDFAYVRFRDKGLKKEITLRLMLKQLDNFCYFRRFQKSLDPQKKTEGLSSTSQERLRSYDPITEHRFLLLGERSEENLPFYKNFIRSTLFYEICPTLQNASIQEQEKMIHDMSALYLLYEFCLDNIEKKKIEERASAYDIENFCSKVYEKFMYLEERNLTLLQRCTFALEMMKRYAGTGYEYCHHVMKSILFATTSPSEQEFLKMLMSKNAVGYANQVFTFSFLDPVVKLPIVCWPNLLNTSNDIALKYLEQQNYSPEEKKIKACFLKLLLYFYCTSLHFEYIYHKCKQLPKYSKEFFSFNKKALIDRMQQEIKKIKKEEQYNILMAQRTKLKRTEKSLSQKLEDFDQKLKNQSSSPIDNQKKSLRIHSEKDLIFRARNTPKKPSSQEGSSSCVDSNHLFSLSSQESLDERSDKVSIHLERAERTRAINFSYPHQDYDESITFQKVQRM